jgi:hypothetical protein
MTDEDIKAAIAVHAAAIEALRELERMREGSNDDDDGPVDDPGPESPQPTGGRQEEEEPAWELAAVAFKKFPFPKHMVRRICANHPEWASKLTNGAWHVNTKKFDPFVAQVNRGLARFTTSETFAMSVADDAPEVHRIGQQFELYEADSGDRQDSEA